ncbi:MAG: insulinase family protein [marine benthic group bacterium]|nr:insulinase family protein [Gemmatimonadota bacterium]
MRLNRNIRGGALALALAGGAGLAIVVSPGRLPAQALADTAMAFTADLGEALPIDPAVTVGQLDNGLRYYIRANERPEKRAELRLVVNAGSVLEDGDQLGLAHFLEHMAFNGTEHFEKQELIDYLQFIGMRFGADVNAYTGFDETVYMLTVPTDSTEIVETAFQILEDWAHGLAFDSLEVEKERGVVLEEWRLGQGAYSRIRDQQFPVLFQGSLYAERLPIGDPEVLETFDHATLKRFYSDWYRPDLMAVVAVGDFDPEWIRDLIHRHFGGLEGPEVARPRPAVAVPGHEETLFSIATDPELTLSNVSVAWKLPVSEDASHGDYRRTFVEQAYNSMFNFRMFEITQSSEDPPFLGAGSGKGRFVRESDVYQLGATVKDGEIEQGLERVLVEAERVSRYGFTESELERQKADVLRSYERAYTERDKRESSRLASEYVRAFLNAEPIPGIEYEYALARRFLPSIELSEVNDVAREWIGDENRVILAASPEKDGITVPDEVGLAAVFGAAVAADIEPWDDAGSDLPLLAELPVPGSVVAREDIPELGVQVWKLSNGARLILKPTDFKEDEVLFNGRSPGGTSLSSDDDYESASWAATLVSVGGVGDFSAVDLQKKLAGKAVSVGPSISELGEGMSGSASPRDLETLFQLVYLYFTAPRRDETAVAAFRSRMGTVLANRGASPEAVYGDSVGAVMAQYHPRYLPPTADMIDRIDLDVALEFYRERFADAGDFTFTLVGAFDPDELLPLVEQYLAALPSSGREETWRDVGMEPPTGVVQRTVRKGLEPKGRQTLIFTGDFDFDRENRYTLQSMTEVLRNMLREILREDMGGTYGVGAYGSGSREPRERYSVRVAFGADPERLDELTEAAFSAIDSLAAHGASEENLAKVKETQRRQRETDLRENGFWLSVLNVYDRNDEDLRLILDYERLVDELTAEAIGEAAALYFDFDNYVEVKLVPEAEGEAEAVSLLP